MVSTEAKLPKKLRVDSFRFTGGRKLDVAYYLEGDDPLMVSPFYSTISIDLLWGFLSRRYTRYKNIEHYLYESPEAQVISDLTACMNEIMLDPLKPFREDIAPEPATEDELLLANFNL